MTESKNVRTAMSVRFGAFEVDLEGRRLLKRGMPITLREQSFQVLIALMERPGEIVTREELRRRLWAEDTFVAFEVALNSAVSRLRDALGDSADEPSFIETIPKRGYRFVVPIAKRPAVAVMPFVNQTADTKDEYFSDGLTDELIRVLSRIDGLRVTARSVVFRFKGQPWDARQVGRELGVEAVLEGSIGRSGDHIRITVNLVGVKDGFNLWAQRFDSTLRDLFGIQDEVCTAVAEALNVRLMARVPERVDASFDVRRDVKLVALHPHMHARGKSFEYRIVFPDGKSETILNVPVYDWHWQLWYNLAEPMNLPQGTKIECTAHFDNSPSNPENPDPTKAIIWGQQSWDEMMVGFFNLKFDANMSPKELKAPEGAVHTH